MCHLEWFPKIGSHMLIYYVGVLLGAWPCGVIVMLGELFGAESKAQVYGLLHAFLQQNKDFTEKISELLDM